MSIDRHLWGQSHLSKTQAKGTDNKWSRTSSLTLHVGNVTRKWMYVLYSGNHSRKFGNYTAKGSLDIEQITTGL